MKSAKDSRGAAKPAERPTTRLTRCPSYWRDPAWGKGCKVCGNIPDYMVEEHVLSERVNGKTLYGLDAVPYCARHVPLENEGLRALVIGRCRKRVRLGGAPPPGA